MKHGYLTLVMIAYLLSEVVLADSGRTRVALQDSSLSTHSASTDTMIPVDKVLVRKRERVMFLMSNGSPVRAYRIALGESPSGHKRYEGDQRTPEGTYTLDWRNPNSRFYKSIHVSYPNETDHEYASSSGFSPGGMIMLHGWPNERSSKLTLDKLLGTDWTDGCIAVSNTAMDEIWERVPDGTPIEIQP
jgi:murein L,D-transpeptidase YafK